MASKDQDYIDFNKLENELNMAIEADKRYWRENDAKFRAVNQKVASYEEFRDIVLASHLQPLDKQDKLDGCVKPAPLNALATVGKDEKSAIPQTEVIKKHTKLPTNGHEFARDWRRLSNCEEKYRFLLELGSEGLGQVFKTEISFGLLGEILATLLICQPKECASVIDILEKLSTINRFSLSLDFLSSKEREDLIQLFNKLHLHLSESSAVMTDLVEQKMSDLKMKYGVS